VQREDSEIATAVGKFWSDFYIAELERFYRAHLMNSRSSRRSTISLWAASLAQ
jgi:hypothetical protein